MTSRESSVLWNGSLWQKRSSSRLGCIVKNLWNKTIALSETKFLGLCYADTTWGLSCFQFFSEELWWKLYKCVTGNLGLCTHINTPFSSRCSVIKTRDSLLSFSPWTAENDSMKTLPQRSKRTNSLDSILFWSAIFCGSSNPPFKGKAGTTATTRHWFYLSERVGCMCSDVGAEYLNHLQRREQGEQRLPLLTPVSSYNSSLNLEDNDLTFWQSFAWKGDVSVYTSFW